MVEQLDAWLQGIGPLAFVALGLAACIEYVFPPFPGDTVVLLGGVYAVRGQQPWGLVFAAVTLGSLLGAAFDYAIGVRVADRMARDPAGSTLGIRHASLVSAQEKMRRYGAWILAFNRFIPGLRGLVFLAAGAARLPFPKVLVLGAVSAMLWNLLMVLAGVGVGGNVERMLELWDQYQRVGWVLIGLAALAMLVRFLQGRRNRRLAAAPDRTE